MHSMRMHREQLTSVEQGIQVKLLFNDGNQRVGGHGAPKEAASKGIGVYHLLRHNALDRRAVRILLDQKVQLALKCLALLGDGMHQSLQAKARVGSHQNRAEHQARGHRQHPRQVVLALSRRMLHAGAQCQLQAKACRAQVGCNRAVAINAGVGAAHQFLLGITVVHGKGVDAQRRVARRQCAKVNGLPANAAGQQRFVDDRACQLEPGQRIGIQALVQRGFGGRCTQAQCAGNKEGITMKCFDGIEITLALAQEGQVALEDGVVANP